MKTLLWTLTIVLSLSVLSMLSGCRGGNCPTPKNPTKKELLVGKKWRLTEIKTDGINSTLTIADLNRRREYFNDDTYRITYIDDPQFVFNGRWGFQNNETLIIYDVNTAAQTTEEIRYISADLLIVRKVEIGSTKDYTYISDQP
jgi:hypothetical protein